MRFLPNPARLAPAALFVPGPACAQVFNIHDENYTLGHLLNDLLWTVALLVAAVAAIYYANRTLHRLFGTHRDRLVTRYAMMSAVVLAVLFLLIILLPFTPENRSSVLTLFGISLSALIALSSTSITGNALAGMLLRPIWNLKEGQYLTIDGVFGRIERIELLRVEMRTELGERISFPSTHVLMHHVKQMPAETAVISTSVSLGFDVDPSVVKPLLEQAATAAGVTGASVWVQEIEDYSVVYQIHGRPATPDRLNESRSRLNWAVLEKLHGAGIEIASPDLVSARMFGKSHVFMPTVKN
ncbi:hypothetical protein DEA8626_03341 [Defluviimonas aquaemixtae]|uniref:Small-conductance mechanosensitive channel n=1 Tax=Albidovulum aquaemixtae TaxID=1542388 RepID=A0A2R8BLM7_9RHOB|nr:mechanosensitive ion channel domain-containing protein [Defluviimonas aquaemixtae]SPH24291.1 hypothetical protein DEA8626_03341 [Defluviimonas aquaemixtae]